MEYISKSLSDTDKVGKKISNDLKKYRIAAFFGNLGSGKTTLVKSIGKALGINKNITSPTFAFVNKYKTKHGNLYHWDFYRTNTSLEAETLGFFEALNEKNSLHVIEWPENILHHLPCPHLKIHCKDYRKGKKYATEIHKLKLPTQKEIEHLWKKYQTPKNVIQHCKVVANLAFKIAKNLKENGVNINPQLVKKSALLHDLLRAIDFDPKKETGERKKIQARLKKQFPKLNHEQAGSALISSLGYDQLGHVILEHSFNIVINPKFLPLTNEGKILNYADKRVLHKDIVSLKERFEDGRKRNIHLLDKKTIDQNEMAIYLLEAEIKKHLTINLP